LIIIITTTIRYKKHNKPKSKDSKNKQTNKERNIASKMELQTPTEEWKNQV